MSPAFLTPTRPHGPLVGLRLTFYTIKHFLNTLLEALLLTNGRHVSLFPVYS